jgi:hypothetical protein
MENAALTFYTIQLPDSLWKALTGPLQESHSFLKFDIWTSKAAMQIKWLITYWIYYSTINDHFYGFCLK